MASLKVTWKWATVVRVNKMPDGKNVTSEACAELQKPGEERIAKRWF